MARTKREARLATGGKPPSVSLITNTAHTRRPLLILSEMNSKKRKEIRQEREMKRIKLENRTAFDDNRIAFEDVIIKYSENGNCENDENTNLLIGKLKIKLKRECCSGKCSLPLPKLINYQALFPNQVFFHDWNAITNMEFCNQKINDSSDCLEADRQFSMEIIQEFIQEQFVFETIMIPQSITSIETNNFKNVEYLTEYRKCGKMCLHKKIENEFEIFIMLINEYEYLYFGYAIGHMFYGLPGLTYLSPERSTSDILQLFPKKMNGVAVPIPLNELLESAKNYFERLFKNENH